MSLNAYSYFSAICKAIVQDSNSVLWCYMSNNTYANVLANIRLNLKEAFFIIDSNIPSFKPLKDLINSLLADLESLEALKLQGISYQDLQTLPCYIEIKATSNKLLGIAFALNPES